MKVLVVGRGGREHAIVDRLLQDGDVIVGVAPGNGGLARLSCQCDRLNLHPVQAFINVVTAAGDYDLTVVGPESYLFDGIADEFNRRGLPIIGPKACAARLEGSKAQTRLLADQAGIPSPEFEVFSDFDLARTYLEKSDRPVVIKADGPAQGKGTFVCDSSADALDAARQLMVDGRLGRSGRRVVVEERLYGEEVSAFYVVDGETILPLATARDYKRLLADDAGPNTGGMGSISPHPELGHDFLEQCREQIAEPLLAALDYPYQGFLYLGLMVVDGRPVLLEVNVRLGDPEAQAVLPRIRSHFGELLRATATGNLAEYDLELVDQVACGVVACSGPSVRGETAYPGYPREYQTGQPIRFGRTRLDETRMFFAGVRQDSGNLVVDGGRVLTAVGLGDTLDVARRRAYRLLEQVDFDGLYYRPDIGASTSLYRSAGVDISAGNRLVRHIQRQAQELGVDQGLLTGGFSGAIALEQPLVLATIDGVGTKILLAREWGRLNTIGLDLVNHCVNDILVQGGWPVFLLDYLGLGSLDSPEPALILDGIFRGCKENEIALIGGEVAEMREIYGHHLDLVGAAVGVTTPDRLLPRPLAEDDVLIGLPSSGPHTNGYTLIRKAVQGLDPETTLEDGLTLVDALCAPHRSYLPEFRKLDQAGVRLKGAAHITGGGVGDNLARVLPGHLDALVTAWPVPTVFYWLMDQLHAELAEMYRVFNMGLGMVWIIRPDDEERVLSEIQDAWRLGILMGGSREVVFAHTGLPWRGRR